MARKLEDIRGRRFGRLTVEQHVRTITGVSSIWSCRCDCGNVVSVRRTNLIQGITKSCGCLHVELSRERMKKLNDELGPLTGNRFRRRDQRD